MKSIPTRCVNGKGGLWNNCPKPWLTAGKKQARDSKPIDEEKKPLKVDVHSQGLMIHLPGKPIDAIDNIIVIKYKGIYMIFRNG
jgi:hypothetical protein